MWRPIHPVQNGKKKCAKCFIEKEVSEYSPQKQCKEGVRPYCRKCGAIQNRKYYANNRENIGERMRDFNKTEHRRAYVRKYQAEWLRKEKERLAGTPRPKICEVCGDAGGSKGICYDHDHKTGKFRGWLCSSCNRSLGFCRDNPIILQRLAAYLSENAMMNAYEESK